MDITYSFEPIKQGKDSDLRISLQEERHFSLTLAPLFVKDLRNPQFSNSGAKVVLMCGY